MELCNIFFRFRKFIEVRKEVEEFLYGGLGSIIRSFEREIWVDGDYKIL